MKYCTDCKKTKPLKDFYKDATTKDGFKWRCKVCSNAYGKKWKKENQEALNEYAKNYRKNNKDVFRNGYLLRHYGITVEQYNVMLEKHNYGCAICGGVNKSGKALCVDHDHSCCPGIKSCGECVRGLLCTTCNDGLGRFRDDEKLLLGAIDYVRKHKKKKP